VEIRRTRLGDKEGGEGRLWGIDVEGNIGFAIVWFGV